MPICYGKVTSKKLQKSSEDRKEISSEVCKLCYDPIVTKPLVCLNSKCELVSHIICLSKFYVATGQYVPIEGKCPLCEKQFLWGDIIRKYKGCNSNEVLDFDGDWDVDCGSDSE